ncbi:unnamed protein product [Protopolystoma xenopodis]|uniref:Uncharacterized protein n=1 Tax=Protopolystoma xenopodis TaxID=117903 RepID=A0A3S5CR35_9PLAT|nr:unnamed protein product [Protopolystoma xenopodis]
MCPIRPSLIPINPCIDPTLPSWSLSYVLIWLSELNNRRSTSLINLIATSGSSSLNIITTTTTAVTTPTANINDILATMISPRSIGQNFRPLASCCLRSQSFPSLSVAGPSCFVRPFLHASSDLPAFVSSSLTTLTATDALTEASVLGDTISDGVEMLAFFALNTRPNDSHKTKTSLIQSCGYDDNDKCRTPSLTLNGQVKNFIESSEHSVSEIAIPAPDPSDEADELARLRNRSAKWSWWITPMSSKRNHNKDGQIMLGKQAVNNEALIKRPSEFQEITRPVNMEGLKSKQNKNASYQEIGGNTKFKDEMRVKLEDALDRTEENKFEEINLQAGESREDTSSHLRSPDTWLPEPSPSPSSQAHRAWIFSKWTTLRVARRLSRSSKQPSSVCLVKPPISISTSTQIEEDFDPRKAGKLDG